MSRPLSVPDHAEELVTNEFMAFHDAPSNLAPGFMQRKWTLTCPRCKHTRPLPEFMRTVNCGGCGLSMQLTGSSLYAWEAEMEAVS